MSGSLAAAALIFAHLVVSPGESPARRVLAAVLDIGTLTWLMMDVGARASPMFLL